MKKILLSAIVVFSLFACAGKQPKVTLDAINSEVQAGNFTQAKAMIDAYIAENELTEAVTYDLLFQKDLMERKAIDFDRTKDDVTAYIRKYYPGVDDALLAKWESANALEAMIIDGEKRYFDNAARNLFRIDKEARARKIEVDGVGEDDLQTLLESHLPEVIACSKKSPVHQSAPQKITITYKLKVDANAVPANEVIRCWLPYPRTDSRRQTNIELLTTDAADYRISPDEYVHKALYMEKTARQDEPTVFSYSFSMETVGEWFGLQPGDIKPYNKESELYKKYTAERRTHVLFGDKIKAISAEIVGDETNPLLVSNRILQYIKDHYPWASALEYSTMDNIPEYVISNNHGDCGMVGLLYITLCRYNGIPARWQSGFMLHPGNVNLHDWTEAYFEGIGWVPVDPSFIRRSFDDKDVNKFYSNGIDAYRWIVNDDYSMELFPAKKYPRSETVDFQR
ncbi:MAG: transglutaminase domain-containing protein, partial [Tannerella sp.]|nr:transglutaminase domain-containing protein [Tannerella sp.]